jgi:hypothetical protein
MSIARSEKPHVSMERSDNGTTVIWLHMGRGEPVGVEIERTPKNAAVVDYFYEKLKDGVEV